MKTTIRPKVALALICLAFALAPIVAQTLWGDWFIVMTAAFPDQAICKYSGRAQIDQNGNQLMGKVMQYLASGPSDRCPEAMNAELEGTVDGMDVTGRLNGGQLFGFASFEGTFAMTDAAGTFATEGESAPTQSLAGLVVGPFPGVQGQWEARLEAPIDVPVLGSLGMVLLAGFFLLSGLFLARG